MGDVRKELDFCRLGIGASEDWLARNIGFIYCQPGLDKLKCFFEEQPVILYCNPLLFLNLYTSCNIYLYLMTARVISPIYIFLWLETVGSQLRGISCLQYV